MRREKQFMAETKQSQMYYCLFVLAKTFIYQTN